MVKSMTSFGRSSSEEGKKRFFTVEMKSVNSRYLDINIRMPKSIISLEEEIRKRIIIMRNNLWDNFKFLNVLVIDGYSFNYLPL